jgi:hypothetical protein
MDYFVPVLVYLPAKPPESLPKTSNGVFIFAALPDNIILASLLVDWVSFNGYSSVSRSVCFDKRYCRLYQLLPSSFLPKLASADSLFTVHMTRFSLKFRLVGNTIFILSLSVARHLQSVWKDSDCYRFRLIFKWTLIRPW